MSSAPRVLGVVFLTVFIFSSIVFAYIVAVNFSHPEWLPLPFSHINFFPLNLRTDTVGIIAFIISATSFLLLGIVSVAIKPSK